MSGDIKEIVNNLNKANSKKDSDDDVSKNKTNNYCSYILIIYLNFHFSWTPFVEF